jgi:hypothetical protein
MPKRKPKKAVVHSRVRRSNESAVTFTFFNSKMFLILVATALIVIVLAILSSSNNPKSQTTEMSGGQYRIDTSNIQTDPSAKNVIDR